MIKRNSSLDVLRIICCFLVVLIHADIKDQFGDYLHLICRISVPIFFMISGYFACGKSESVIIKRGLKNLKLMIYSDLFYIVIELIKCVFNRATLSDIIGSLFNVNFLFFNIGDIGGHLWFLRALVYVYFIYAILIKIKKVDYVLYILPIIYVIDLIVCKYSLVIFNDSLPIYVYEPITKFFGTGFLSFSLGFFIKNVINKRLKNTILFLLILNIIEFMLLNYHSKDVILCNYIFTIPLAYFVFAYFLQLRDIGSDNIFARIGKNNSTDIYVYHILILEVFNALFASYFNIYMYFRAFLIFFVTLIISMILNNFRKIRR